MGMTAENIAEKRCYTVKEVQEMLGISRPTVYELLKKNEFLDPDWKLVSYFKEEF